jgi:hypothetical protein
MSFLRVCLPHIDAAQTSLASKRPHFANTAEFWIDTDNTSLLNVKDESQLRTLAIGGYD